MLSNSMITDFTRSYYHCWCKKYQIITDLTKLFSILKLSLWINKIQTHCTFLWVTGQVWYTWHSIQSKATLKLGLQSWTGQWWLLPSGKWREVCNFWYKLKLNKEKKITLDSQNTCGMYNMTYKWNFNCPYTNFSFFTRGTMSKVLFRKWKQCMGQKHYKN